MNKKEFKEIITTLFPNVNEQFFAKIEIYKEFLQQYNENVNLTNLCDEQKVYGDYFYESVVPYAHIDFSKIISVLDIGSGSGIPGVVLKLLFNNIALTIIESNNKKVTFLKALCDKLDLNDVKVLYTRAENITNSQRESFDLVTSRAVAPLKPILEISIPYAKINGIILEPKSKNYKNESVGLEKLVSELGGGNIQVKNFESVQGIEHNVVIIEKVSLTPNAYPRQWSKIIKDGK